MYGAAVGGVQT